MITTVKTLNPIEDLISNRFWDIYDLDIEVIDLDMIKEPIMTPTIVEEETTQTMVDATSANSEAGNTMPPRLAFQHRKYS